MLIDVNIYNITNKLTASTLSSLPYSMSCTNSNDGAGTRPNARSLPHSSTLETPAAESLAQYAFEKLTHDVTQTQHNAAELQQQLKPQLDLINSQTSTGGGSSIQRNIVLFFNSVPTNTKGPDQHKPHSP